MAENLPDFNRTSSGYDDSFLAHCRIPNLTDLITTTELFWQHEPKVRHKAISLHASELKTSGSHFYIIASHLQYIKAMGGNI